MLYGWAKNAAGTRLPPSVGFRIGDKSKAKYLVIQVHYATKLPQGELDYSGVDLEITSKPYANKIETYILFLLACMLGVNYFWCGILLNF